MLFSIVNVFYDYNKFCTDNKKKEFFIASRTINALTCFTAIKIQMKLICVKKNILLLLNYNQEYLKIITIKMTKTFLNS